MGTINEYVSMGILDLAEKFTFKFNKTNEEPSEIKMLIMYGENDTLVVPQDAQKTVERLRDSGQNLTACRVSNFNHLDFVYGDDAKEKVYNTVISFLKGIKPRSRPCKDYSKPVSKN